MFSGTRARTSPRLAHCSTLANNQALTLPLIWRFSSLVSGHTKTPARPSWGLAGVCTSFTGRAVLSRPPVWLLLSVGVDADGAQRHAGLHLCEHSFSRSLAPA